MLLLLGPKLAQREGPEGLCSPCAQLQKQASICNAACYFKSTIIVDGTVFWQRHAHDSSCAWQWKAGQRLALAVTSKLQLWLIILLVKWALCASMPECSLPVYQSQCL